MNLLRLWAPVQRVLCLALLAAFAIRAMVPHQPWALIAIGTAVDLANLGLNIPLTRHAKAAAARKTPQRSPLHPDGGAPAGCCPICGQYDPDGLGAEGWHPSCMEWLGDGESVQQLRRASERRQRVEEPRRRDQWISRKAREQDLLEAGRLPVNDMRSRVVQANCAHVSVGDYATWGGPTFRVCHDCGAQVSAG